MPTLPLTTTCNCSLNMSMELTKNEITEYVRNGRQHMIEYSNALKEERDALQYQVDQLRAQNFALLHRISELERKDTSNSIESKGTSIATLTSLQETKTCKNTTAPWHQRQLQFLQYQNRRQRDQQPISLPSEIWVRIICLMPIGSAEFRTLRRVCKTLAIEGIRHAGQNGMLDLRPRDGDLLRQDLHSENLDYFMRNYSFLRGLHVTVSEEWEGLSLLQLSVKESAFEYRPFIVGLRITRPVLPDVTYEFIEKVLKLKPRLEYFEPCPPSFRCKRDVSRFRARCVSGGERSIRGVSVAMRTGWPHVQSLLIFSQREAAESGRPPFVTGLDLWLTDGFRATDDDMRLLGGLHRLRLRNWPSLYSLSALSRVPDISLCQCSHVRSIVPLRHAYRVSIHECKRVTNISCLSKVKYVSIAHCPMVTDASELNECHLVSLVDTGVTNVSMLRYVPNLWLRK